MGFASEYLSDRVLFEPFIQSIPGKDVSIIVIIPAFNEPDLLDTINSLANCHLPDCGVEVLVHINSGESAADNELDVNRKSLEEIESRREDSSLPFRLFAFSSNSSSIKGWGAGLARKVAMDEAVSRFSSLNNEEGLIVSLDADCDVSPDYLTKLYSEFYLDKKRKACSIYFEHPISGKQFDKQVYRAITQYELHLRYYYQALVYCGYPEVFHTVGSAFAVRAGVYVKAGGMNRKQAGEDFYFIQKTIPMGGYFYLNSVTVKPSPRTSDRVPFGTGPAIRDIVNSDKPELLSYNPDSFTAIRNLFLSVHRLYKAELVDFEAIENSVGENALEFLQKENWRAKVKEINANTSSIKSFEKRFFSWFNMFKVVKYLNWAHSESRFSKISVSFGALKLLGLLGMDHQTRTETELLEFFRSMEL
jgi:hypothetical protein